MRAESAAGAGALVQGAGSGDFRAGRVRRADNDLCERKSRGEKSQSKGSLPVLLYPHARRGGQHTVSGWQRAMHTSASQGLQRVVVMGSPTKQFVGVGAGAGVGVALGVIVVYRATRGSASLQGPATVMPTRAATACIPSEVRRSWGKPAPSDMACR